MTEINTGDLIVATAGDNRLAGRVTLATDLYLDVDVVVLESTDNLTIARGVWTVEKQAPEEPTGFNPVIKFETYVPSFKGNDGKWAFASTPESKYTWEQLLNYVGNRTEFEILYNGF